MAKDFQFYKQHDANDCGAACLKMVAQHFGKSYSMEDLREITFLEKAGVSLMSISNAAEAIGMHTLGVNIDYERLEDDMPMPCIAHWRQEHFVVVYKITKKNVWIADPAAGKFKISKSEFLDGWVSNTSEDGGDVGIILLMEPTPDFYSNDGSKQDKSTWSYLGSHFRPYRGLINQALLGFVFISSLQLLFPFFLKGIVDVGIKQKDMNFLVLILAAHIILFVSQTAVEQIRNWIVMHIGSRVNIKLVSNFLIKMMRLPTHFFDSRLAGDIIQRVDDNRRVESFLSTNTLVTIFSIFNFILFGIVLFYFDLTIFTVFLIATCIHFLWIYIFSGKRRELDYKRFDQMSENQSNLIELIGGIKEIKLHNAEKQKRWRWERVQAKLFHLGIDYLKVEQYQRAGGRFVNELKNIIIIFLSAAAVVNGNMSLGTFVAIQYIVGQLNAPVDQLVGFVAEAQSAKISLERMNDIHNKAEEEIPGSKLNVLPEDGTLELDKVSFRYGGPDSKQVLKNISLRIPEGKTTAIVGTSGSGKTTLIKLLLGFYKPTDGDIRLGNVSLDKIQQTLWRNQCGTVMQDGYLFSETIAQNIALGDEIIDEKKLIKASIAANFQSFVDQLPLGFKTRVGQNGMDLSAGEKQRLLIARLIYKNPNYLFFDEATNALDAYNELIIMENLEDLFHQKTVVVVAHRLSTVKNADRIIVIEDGEIIEQGTHETLTQNFGAYYYLVKNQLELGN